jgi:CRISPR/Cas system type I-B associated protein Csh2 (Cas7 group RAMP superfamily)
MAIQGPIHKREEKSIATATVSSIELTASESSESSLSASRFVMLLFTYLYFTK